MLKTVRTPLLSLHAESLVLSASCTSCIMCLDVFGGSMEGTHMMGDNYPAANPCIPRQEYLHITFSFALCLVRYPYINVTDMMTRQSSVMNSIGHAVSSTDVFQFGDPLLLHSFITKTLQSIATEYYTLCMSSQSRLSDLWVSHSHGSLRVYFTNDVAYRTIYR